MQPIFFVFQVSLCSCGFVTVHHIHCIEVRGVGDLDEEIVSCYRWTLRTVVALSNKYCYWSASRLSS